MFMSRFQRKEKNKKGRSEIPDDYTVAVTDRYAERRGHGSRMERPRPSFHPVERPADEFPDLHPYKDKPKDLT